MGTTTTLLMGSTGFSREKACGVLAPYERRNSQIRDKPWSDGAEEEQRSEVTCHPILSRAHSALSVVHHGKWLVGPSVPPFGVHVVGTRD